MILKKNTWENACIHVDLLRIYAIIPLLSGAVIGAFIYADSLNTQSGGHDLSFRMYSAAFFFILGLTNLFGFRIPAIAFSLVGVAIAYIQIAGGIILMTQHPLMLIPTSIRGLLALLPLFSTIRGWQALR